MALKRTINKAAFDALPEAVRFEYKKDGDDFVLQTEGDEDAGALKRALTRATERGTERDKENRDLQAQLDELKATRSDKDRDLDRLTKSHEKEVAKVKGDYEGKVLGLTNKLTKVLVDATAGDIAGKIAPAAKNVMLPHVRSRLVVNLDGDEPKVEILGKDGKVDAKLKVEDLEKEFVANPDFKTIVVPNKASGGAATTRGLPTTQPAVGAAPNATQAVPLSKFTPVQLAAHIKAGKEEAAQSSEAV